MMYSPLDNHNIMELWLFETCNFRCGYCSLVPSGAVARTDQLDAFRDDAYVDRLATFFSTHRPANRPWAVLLTGGEPFLMPNMDRFVRALGAGGDTVGVYSNMSVPIEKALSTEALSHLCYVQASFHPDWHMGRFEEDRFFANVARLKDLGIPVVVRFVAAPAVLDLLPHLAGRCEALGVELMATTLFNPEYPRNYTRQERERLASYMVGYSSLLQLDGGVVMRGRRCTAADRLFAARLHQGGDVTPCISVDKPVLGNIIQNTLQVKPGLKGCVKADHLCSCDIHFQQGIVEGADDRHEFAAIMRGKGIRRAAEFEHWKRENRILTDDAIWVGQGLPIHRKEDLLRVAPRTHARGAAAQDD
jgi:MoaA/NifB/PqqE/SkfB family radical SAM enzyme